ncbi:MAG: tetratricopeptide repeat protein [Planctomycetaceae bacterium]
MHWKRFAHAFLLGSGVSLASVGCSAVDALVSSPAGYSAQQGSPERLVAIGRVFENQGRLAQAEELYRKSLKQDPNNALARERLAAIESGRLPRRFDGTLKETQSALALADGLNSGRRLQKSQIERAAETTASDAAATLKHEHDAVLASLTPATARAQKTSVSSSETQVSHTAAGSAAEEVVAQAAVLIDSFAQPNADGHEQQDDDWSISVVPLEVPETRLSFAPARSETAEVPEAFASEGGWKASSRVVTLEEVLEWSDVPGDHVDELTLALTNGADDGVKSLAAALLAEAPTENQDIDACLLAACDGGSSLLRVTARDTLIQRGQMTEETVCDLLTLLTDSNADIQGQAAAALRYFVDTEWSERCVSGLGTLLTSDDPGVVAIAAATLGDFGHAAVSERSRLMQLVGSEENDLVLEAASLALLRIPPQDVTLAPVDGVLRQVGHDADGQHLNHAAGEGSYLPAAE